MIYLNAQLDDHRQTVANYFQNVIKIMSRFNLFDFLLSSSEYLHLQNLKFESFAII